MNSLLNKLKQSEIALAIGIVGVLIILFVPLPAILLDFFFALNIAISIIILFTVLLIKKSTEFSVFPLTLLITTMFRLSLNVASTRLILSKGHDGSASAGKVIETFGNFVMGGEFIIGLVLFIILVIVNFMVVTKGSGRIAEVSARFTLDSLPGKQMAIDADLNAGMIDEAQARARRTELEEETGFFGAMDGASKFVRGDAIAGLIITAINAIVGLSIGVISHDMSFNAAADSYLLMTVGDGLVAQIPALVISISAGILIAKSSDDKAVGTAIFNQIGANHQTFFMVAAVLFLIGTIPNMPGGVFWLLAGSSGYYGYFLMKKGDQKVADEQLQAEEEQAGEVAQEAVNAEDSLTDALSIDTLKIELGYGLLKLVDVSKGGRLMEQIKAMRRQLAKEVGFVVPNIRIRENMQFEPGGYSIAIKDIEVTKTVLEADKLLAMDPTGTSLPIDGEDTVEPTFGLPAKWIEESKREEASFSGYTVVDCSTVITTHITEIIKDNMPDLLTRNEVEKLLEDVSINNEKLVEELVPEKIAFGSFQRILQNLLEERVSIKDLPTILEALSEAIESTKDVQVLTEQVRIRLSRQLCHSNTNHEGAIPVISLSAAWETEFLAATDGSNLAMEPSKVQGFLKLAKEKIDSAVAQGENPIILTSAGTRKLVRSVTSRAMPHIAVLSQNEIHQRVSIKSLGQI
ncbi:MAG: flagellar biosynthesis protein FlhA [Proteobacteria bacterium]|nr:flagellar biosynthesis protein FlhA [Pseudomonadota bacterium]